MVGWVVTACLVVLALLPGEAAQAPTTRPTPSAAAPSAAAPAADPGGVRVEQRRATAVLRAWDARRAAAWAAGEPAALRSLYTRGSSAGAADARLLRRWSDAGWRVERLTTQLLSLRVQQASDDRLDLRLVDRVAGGQIVSEAGLERPLPATRPVTRRLLLRLVGGEWRVSASGPAPRAPRR